jgi:hypothetical protein
VRACVRVCVCWGGGGNQHFGGWEVVRGVGVRVLGLW